MLHILLLILKVIGIIIAAILGILVLFVGIVLFVPVRYRAKAKCEGPLETLQAGVRFTWLMHLVRVDGQYKEGRMAWRVRVAWKTLAGARAGEQRRTVKEEPDGKDPDKEKEPDTGKKPDKEKKGEEVREYDETPGEKMEGREENSEKNADDEAAHEAETAEKGTEEAAKEAAPDEPERPEVEEGGQKQKAVEADRPEASAVQGLPGRHEKVSFTEKIKAWFHKIKCTFTGFCDKIKLLLQKKEKVQDFLEDECHRRAFRRVWREVTRLLRKLKPGKVHVRVLFGCEDPYHTGQILAGLSLIYPFVAESVSVVPDFERRVLKGRASASGKLRAFDLAWPAAKLYFCREVRDTYRQIKNFEL